MSQYDEIFANGVKLPSPTAFNVNDEIIWSADTGRLYHGDMFGSVVNEKKTISIKWEFLPAIDVMTIKRNCCAGFFTFTYYDGSTWQTIQVYRGTITQERMHTTGVTTYYRSVTLDIIEK